MWKWLTDGRSDSSWLLGALVQGTVVALLYYAARSGRNWLFISIPGCSLILATASLYFGGMSGGRFRYSPVRRRQWRSAPGHSRREKRRKV